MEASEMTAYLHTHIPLSLAMGVKVSSINFSLCELALPLEPNLNHRNTAFGGSISAAATLSAWTLISHRLGLAYGSNRLVIQSHQINYLRPIEAAFAATCEENDIDGWDTFLSTVKRHGKGRVKVEANVTCDGRICATFSGLFVAFAQPST